MLRRNPSSKFLFDISGEVTLGAVATVHEVTGHADHGGPGCNTNYVLQHFNNGWNTNSWEKLIKSTSYLFYWAAKVEYNKGQQVTRDYVQLTAKQMAVTFWMIVAMPDTNKAAVEGRLKHLAPLQHNKYPDMLVVIGRAVSVFQYY